MNFLNPLVWENPESLLVKQVVCTVTTLLQRVKVLSELWCHVPHDEFSWSTIEIFNIFSSLPVLLNQ
jgi:hypothetical protein